MMWQHIRQQKNKKISNVADNNVREVVNAKDEALLSIERKKDAIIEFLDGTDIGELRVDVGVMDELETEDKSSLVGAVNEVNKQVKQVSEPKYVSTTSYDNVVSMPDGSTNGQVSMSVEGETRTNLVKNSDMNIDTNNDGVVDSFDNGVGIGIIAKYTLDDVQKIEIIDSTTITNYAEVKQSGIPITENNIFSACVDVKIIGNINVAFFATAYDNNNAWLEEIETSPKVISSGIIKLDNVIAPQGTKTITLTLKVSSNNIGDTGSVWIKNMMVEMASSVGNYISSGTKSTISAMRAVS